MDEETIEVPRSTLEDLQATADYSASKLSKTFDWEGPTQKMRYVSAKLEYILGETDEDPEPFEFEPPF